jgi:hypothetical protein
MSTGDPVDPMTGAPPANDVTPPDPGDGPLVCPSCGADHPPGERFCASCEMPLVVPGDASVAERPDSEKHARARKIRPEYARGDLVRVAGGRNLAEAELITGFLLEEGIPSMVRRSAAFDVPDFLAAGQRDVLVPESGAPAARELLAEADRGAESSVAEDQGAATPRGPRAFGAAGLAAAILAGGLTAALIAWGLAQSMP